MPVYVEMIKDKKTGKNIEKIVDGKKQYYIRTYVTDENGNAKQIKRHNKNWLGRSGKEEAEREEKRLRNEPIINQDKKANITLHELKEKYIEYKACKLDVDTIKALNNRLNHFCENDITKQVNTFPNKKISSPDWKEIYINWQLQMKNKLYRKGTHPRKNEQIGSNNKWVKYSINFLNIIHNEIINMLDYGIAEGYLRCNFAIQAGKIGTSKEIKISNQQKKYKVIDYEEYKKLIEVSKDDLKYNTIFKLWFKRGPRPGEIRAFRVLDYNREQKQLMVNHTMSKDNTLKEPKTSSSKAPIDLDDELNNQISKIIDNLKKEANFSENWYIFNGPTPISSNALEHNKEKYFKLANIDKHIKLHEFRHSCATWLFSIGIPITVISKILRHQDIKVTMETYTHLLDNDYQNWLTKINNF